MIIGTTVFYDEAVLVRRGTVYSGSGREKAVALTFDDGPSPVWTPQILEALRRAGIKATFFMLGEHARKYPGIARSVAEEGHEIANHGYRHELLFFRKKEEMEREIKAAETAIREATGVSTKYFRPPKAWLTKAKKDKIEKMGYKTVLWSLNSKDWAAFRDRDMAKYIERRVRPGDIILFHDSGNVFGAEGGDRRQTVRSMPKLAEILSRDGYKFVTISELIDQKEAA